MSKFQSIGIPVTLLSRPRDAHKGTMGHALLISGRRGMAGAAILASRACLRSGVGKLTVATPSYNIPILQVAIPEAIISPSGDNEFTQIIQTTQFQAVAIGPGLGTDSNTVSAVLAQIKECRTPIVVDADAINILALHPEALHSLPSNSILTPHIGELNRLIGKTSSADERLRLTLELSQRLHIYIIIKGITVLSAVLTVRHALIILVIQVWLRLAAVTCLQAYYSGCLLVVTLLLMQHN